MSKYFCYPKLEIRYGNCKRKWKLGICQGIIPLGSSHHCRYLSLSEMLIAITFHIPEDYFHQSSNSVTMVNFSAASSTWCHSIQMWENGKWECLMFMIQMMPAFSGVVDNLLSTAADFVLELPSFCQLLPATSRNDILPLNMIFKIKKDSQVDF